MHPLPARGEDELGVIFQTMINVANTAAGSGLHDADCSASDSLSDEELPGKPSSDRNSDDD